MATDDKDPLFKDTPLTDAEMPSFLNKKSDRRTRANWKSLTPPNLTHNSPGFRPTPAQSKMVAKLRGLGHNPHEIALVLDIDKNLLEFYYSYELKTAKIRTTAAVAAVALRGALSGRDGLMTRWWLESQGGFKTKTVVEHEGLDAEADAAKAARSKLLD